MFIAMFTMVRKFHVPSDVAQIVNATRVTSAKAR